MSGIYKITVLSYGIKFRMFWLSCSYAHEKLIILVDQTLLKVFEVISYNKFLSIILNH